jgi:hypothetical protein
MKKRIFVSKYLCRSFQGMFKADWVKKFAVWIEVNLRNILFLIHNEDLLAGP